MPFIPRAAVSGGNLRLSAELQGAAEVSEGLLQLSAAGKSLRPLMRTIGGILTRSVRDTIRQGGRPAWPPRKSGGKGRPLGSLWRTIRARPARRSVAVGSTDYRARFHQFGAVIKLKEERPTKKKAMKILTPGGVVFARRVKPHTIVLPARPFLAIQPEDAVAIQEATRGYLVKLALRQAFKLGL